MKVKELRTALVGVDGDMEVLLRVMHDDGDGLAIGDAECAQVSAGCTDTECFIIDGGSIVIGNEELDDPIPHLTLVKR